MITSIVNNVVSGICESMLKDRIGVKCFSFFLLKPRIYPSESNSLVV